MLTVPRDAYPSGLDLAQTLLTLDDASYEIPASYGLPHGFIDPSPGTSIALPVVLNNIQG